MFLNVRMLFDKVHVWLGFILLGFELRLNVALAHTAACLETPIKYTVGNWIDIASLDTSELNEWLMLN